MSKYIHSNVEREVSNVSQFTFLGCMVCAFPCNEHADAHFVSVVMSSTTKRRVGAKGTNGTRV